MDEVLLVQLIFLGCLLLGTLLRAVIGWLQSGNLWNWRHFVVSVVPAWLVLTALAFDIDPVWSLKTCFFLLLSAYGGAEFQSALVDNKGLVGVSYKKKR